MSDHSSLPSPLPEEDVTHLLVGDVTQYNPTTYDDLLDAVRSNSEWAVDALPTLTNNVGFQAPNWLRAVFEDAAGEYYGGADLIDMDEDIPAIARASAGVRELLAFPDVARFIRYSLEVHSLSSIHAVTWAPLGQDMPGGVTHYSLDHSEDIDYDHSHKLEEIVWRGRLLRYSASLVTASVWIVEPANFNAVRDLVHAFVDAWVYAMETADLLVGDDVYRIERAERPSTGSGHVTMVLDTSVGGGNRADVMTVAVCLRKTPLSEMAAIRIQFVHILLYFGFDWQQLCWPRDAALGTAPGFDVCTADTVHQMPFTLRACDLPWLGIDPAPAAAGGGCCVRHH